MSVRKPKLRRWQSLHGEFEHQKLEDRLMLTAGNGLQAQYFSAPDLTQQVLVRIDPDVDFNWETGSPAGSVANDNFSVRWTGQIESQFTETYSFIVNANDGARLWVNGHLLVDQFDQGTLSDATASIDLIAGRRYEIQLEYRENTGDASVRLEWSSDSLSREVVPTNRLYAADRGTITSERWNTISGSEISNLTGDANFPSNPDVVSSLTSFQSNSNAGSDFGQRLRGYVHAPVTGIYTFYVAGDQAAELWLSNTSDANQKELIASTFSATQPLQWNASTTQKSDSIHLVAGQRYYIEALHKESTGADHLAVGWTVPDDTSIEVIEGEYLSPVVPEVRIYAQRPSASEGSAVGASFLIVRSRAATNLPLDVSYSLSGAAENGVDFQTLSGTTTIPAGADSIVLELVPLIDGIFESDESVVIELVASSGYEVGFKSERTAHGSVQDNSDAPAGGTSLWNGQQLSDFSFYGGNFSTVNVPVYGDVIQAVINGTQVNPWDASISQDINASVVKGDILLVEFRARSINGPGNVTAIFQRAGSPFTKSLSQGIPLTGDWARIQIPFAVLENYAAGEASFGFHLANGAQTIQFTDFQVLNYGPPQSVSPENAFFLSNIGGDYGNAQTVPITGQTFSSAFEIQTTTIPPDPWRLQAVDRNDAAIAAGDTMRFEFWIRSTAGTNPQAQFGVQWISDGYSGVFYQPLNNLTSTWEFHSYDVVAGSNFPVNDLQSIFTVGYELQTIQIAGFTWKNLANSGDIEILPKQFPTASYGGRGGTDAWRDSADTRIDDDRKSSVTVNVTDINGVAVDGAVVSLRQNDHAFRFGSAINAYGNKLDPNGNAEALKYQSEIKRLFNTVVLENSLKWPGFQNDPQRAADGVNFTIDNDLYLRGHNIIWPSRTFMPSNIWTEYDSRVAADGLESAKVWLDSTIDNHIANVLTSFTSITEWDVVNEPYANNDVMDIFGDGIVLEWFQQVRDFNPDIKLTLNDYGIFARNGADANHRANFDYWLGLLNNAGLLDVIGEQSHYNDANLTDIAALGQLIGQYESQFNQPIAITEFDVDSRDLQLQADYLRDYLTMSFSQQGVDEFLHWGFWQDSHWLPDASLYRSDFSVKPNGQAYEDLVFGRWWTDIQGTTRDGAVTADAFLGQYDVVVQFNGETYNATVTVDSSGNSTVDVGLPISAASSIVEYGVSYGGSFFGESVMVPGITALKPGNAATAANYTNFTGGLNRVLVDISGLPTNTLSETTDFIFRVGNSENMTQWTTLSGAQLPGVSVSASGVTGVDRIMLTFADNAIENSWLQVTINATNNTGLSTPDVFYFGNQIGDVNGDVNTENEVAVNAFDTGLVRLNQTPGSSVGIENPYDVDRSGSVNAFDTGLVRLNQSITGGLLMLTAPSPPPAGFQAGLTNEGSGLNIQLGDTAGFARNQEFSLGASSVGAESVGDSGYGFETMFGSALVANPQIDYGYRDHGYRDYGPNEFDRPEQYRGVLSSGDIALSENPTIIAGDDALTEFPIDQFVTRMTTREPAKSKNQVEVSTDLSTKIELVDAVYAQLGRKSRG